MTWFMIIDVSTVEWKFLLGFPEWENYKFWFDFVYSNSLATEPCDKNTTQWSTMVL